MRHKIQAQIALKTLKPASPPHTENYRKQLQLQGKSKSRLRHTLHILLTASPQRLD